MSEAQPEEVTEEKKEETSSQDKTVSAEEKKEETAQAEEKRVSIEKTIKPEEAPTEKRASVRISVDKDAKPDELSEKRDKSKSMIDKMSKTKIRSSMSMQATRSFSRLKVRKPSYGFGSVPGIRPLDRSSQMAIEFKRPPLLYMNTYQLDSFHEFHLPTVEKIINSLLDEHFTGHKYSIAESPIVTMRVAAELMRQVKVIGFNRYRIIAVVTLGQKRSQSYNNAIAFLWDYKRDNYVNVQREVCTAFIQVTVFGIYLD